MNKKIRIAIVMIIAMSMQVISVSAMVSGSDTEYSVVDVKNGGTISGAITFDGQMSEAKKISVSKDTKVCGKHKMDESLLVDATTKGIQNAVVYLKKIGAGKKWRASENSFAMDQKGCQFTPRVLVVPAGEKFLMLNNDGILHNIHTRSELNKEINKAQPRFLKKMKLTFEKPEFVKVACDVHNWMQGWVVVASNPYYTVTGKSGKFEITNVPAGTYELQVWHEKLAPQTAQVQVKAGETTSVDISLK
ncbi:MAG: carboxypeptidase regulatory-like domain-containing protein [bacterium]